MTRSTAVRMFFGVATAALLIFAATPAHAQYSAPPPPPQSYGPPSAQPYPPPPAEPPADLVRTGWYFGLSLGGGGITSHNQDYRSDPLDAFLADIHFGGMVTPQLGIQLELWTAIHDYGDYDNSQLLLNNVGIAAQYWITPKLWIKAGLGSATQEYQVDGQTQSSIDGDSFLAGVGYEFVQRGGMAIDVQLNTTLTSYPDSGADSTSTTGLKFGISWF